MSKKKKKDYSAFEDTLPLCPHFDKCGGCSLQKISYEKQLLIKEQEVRELLEISDEAGSERVFEGIIASPAVEAYRNKMEFTFGDEFKGGPFSLGLHMRGSFMNIVNITDCRLVHQDMNVIRNAAKDFFEKYYEIGQVSFRNNKSGKGYLRHLLIRRAHFTGEIMTALVTTSQYPQADEVELLERFKDMLLGLNLEGTLTGIMHIVNDSTSDVVQSDRTDILFGRDYIYEELLGLRFRISVFSFFQTNSQGAQVLYEKAREYASNAKGTLYDLYSGTGTIAQLMSSCVEKVTGVEIVKEASEAAKENAALNGIRNVEFIADDVLHALDTLDIPDYIILDPPREGINPKALGKILRYGVPDIVYISCKPSSLARDLQAFRLAGYEMIKVCCVDMFPQTVNTETVCLLSNRKPDTKVRIDVDLEDYYRIKDSKKNQN